MNFLSFIKRRHTLSVPDTFLKKYAVPHFKDMSIQEELAQKGFAVRQLLNKEDIEELNKAFQLITDHPSNEISDLFWNSGRATSTEVRNIARRSIDRFVKPHLESFFLPDKVDLMGGVFVAKPVSTNSALNPHQDSSHVDESKFLSFYAWCTLTDVDIENGAVHIVPGSHFFGNAQRSLNIPWQFESYTDILWEHAEPVPMKAGQVLFFDSAAIHCSPPNNSKELRLAVNFFIKPRDAIFTHYYRDNYTPDGMIEKFAVDIDFYYDKNFEIRPGKEYPLLGTEPFIDLKLNSKKLADWCIAAKRQRKLPFTT